jgi:hypothetical protein
MTVTGSCVTNGTSQGAAWAGGEGDWEFTPGREVITPREWGHPANRMAVDRFRRQS